ncbi:MAG: hypothetical protein KAT58_02350 [candidate division Zixibacteria bacterium]|nr:hypothetical protein [candidate division Zixibacteria bacterium]
MLHKRLIVSLVSLLVLATASGLDAKLFCFKTTHEYPVEEGFDLNIANTSGDITIEFRAGDKVIVEVVKEIRASSCSEAEDLEEELQVNIEATEKEIEIDGEIKLETVSGNIDTDLNLEIRSFSKYKLEGRVGRDGPLVELSSTSGDISLEEY